MEKFVAWLKRYRWLLIIGLFAVCVAFKLNGSSVGVWQEVLREPGPPRGLLLFKPKRIRADEWRTITPSMLSQAHQSPPFPIENDNLGAGRTPLLLSIPVAHYTMIFRPQLWGFFFLDFERGFSFYWCCKIFGLLVASVWFLRQIGIKSAGLVAFGTLWIYFSSFMQWWFSTPAMLPEMMASWAIITGLALRFFSGGSPLQLTWAVLGFVFFGAGFVLCLYPGFQIPLLYVSVAIVLGIWLQRRRSGDWRATQGLVLLATSSALLVVILIPFWFSVRDTLEIISQTVYPGPIRSRGGGLSIFQLLSGVFGFFESENRALPGYGNICEASNFYPLALGVFIALIVARWRNRISVPPLLLTLAAPIIILGIYCLTPFPIWLARGSLLGFATVTRHLLGIGIANILICCVFFDTYRARILPGFFFALGMAFICLIAGLWLARPLNDARVLLIIALNALLIGLFFCEQARRWFLITFIALATMNGIAINPVMTGLSPLLEAEAFQRIDKLHRADPERRWIAYEDRNFPQLVKATGASVLNGTKIVPDVPLMQELGPSANDRAIWNRYASVVANLPEYGDAVTFRLAFEDLYVMTLPPELPLLRQRHYDYALFPRNWMNAELHSFSFVNEIEPTKLYIYRRNPEELR